MAVIGGFVWWLVRKEKKEKSEAADSAASGNNGGGASEGEKPVNGKPSEGGSAASTETPSDEGDKTQDGDVGQQPADEGSSQGPVPVASAKERLDKVLQFFHSSNWTRYVNEKGTIYGYLMMLADEAERQLTDAPSKRLPPLMRERNFSLVYNYFKGTGSYCAQQLDVMIGWMTAMLLSEVCPARRTEFFTIGYQVGGYGKQSPLYGYTFYNDPNVRRLVASVIYSAMRGLYPPDIKRMREEFTGESIGMTVSEIRHSSPYEFGSSGAYIDLRKFMASAPGPYSPGYDKDRTTTADLKADNRNLQTDVDIYNYITELFNLDRPDDTEVKQNTVQAIADKDSSLAHLFGDMFETEHYIFDGVFGEGNIGVEIDPKSELARLVDDVMHCASYQRSILQHNDKTLGQVEYGRCRPGADELTEGRRKSYTDDRLNVLVDFEIENGDGNPTGYYDAKNNWVKGRSIKSPAEYNDKMKDELWPNSYPSGHSAAAWGACMVLCEVMPHRSDLIMKAANAYAVNRTIARYHWTSDTIQGRVLASAICAVIRASQDYDELIKKCLVFSD